MALPQLSPEQREEALKKAAAARKARADFKNRIKTGELTPSEALHEAQSTEFLHKMTTKAFLEAWSRLGKVRVAQAMEDIGIANNRRLRGLGSAQLRKVLDFLEESYPSS